MVESIFESKWCLAIFTFERFQFIMNTIHMEFQNTFLCERSTTMLTIKLDFNFRFLFVFLTGFFILFREENTFYLSIYQIVSILMKNNGILFPNCSDLMWEKKILGSFELQNFLDHYSTDKIRRTEYLFGMHQNFAFFYGWHQRKNAKYSALVISSRLLKNLFEQWNVRIFLKQNTYFYKLFWRFLRAVEMQKNGM